MPQDKKGAALYFRKAADKGSQSSMENLAMMLIRGDGVPKDMQLGAQWLVKAAQQGDYLEELVEKIHTGSLDSETKIKLSGMIDKLRDINAKNPFIQKEQGRRNVGSLNDDSPASGW